jgi:hypothetical protein
MEEVFAWQNIWIALGAFMGAAAFYWKVLSYLKTKAPWWYKILFAAFHFLTTATLIAFALFDNTHRPSPLAAYVNAVVAFVAISGIMVTWALFDRARSLR